MHFSFLVGIVIVGCLGQNVSAQWFLPEALVEIPVLGRIQGLKWWTSSTNLSKAFIAFHGIKYAHDTSGENRFKPSRLYEEPLTSDGSDFLAIDPFIMCPQGMLSNAKAKKVAESSTPSLFTLLKEGIWKWNKKYEEPTVSEINAEPRIREDEDCLVLNVNTPKIPSESEEPPKWPVIFFIHGGSSTSMWGAPFTGFRFLEHEVVLVTINYRLGVLGALNLGIDDAPGNAAMYDVITALDWVQKYIHHFGGDKDRVVVYGHSAGSMMASHLLFSKLATGKLHGVIGSSGSAIAPWGAAEENSISHHLEVAYNAECYDDADGIPKPGMTQPDYQQVYECMKNVSESVLRRSLSRYTDKKTHAGELGFDAKSPSVQNGEWITIPKFLEEMPAKILKKGTQNPVNLIMGANKHDGSVFFEDIYDDYLVYHGLLRNTSFMRNDVMPLLIRAFKATETSGAFQHILGQTFFGDGIKNGIYEEMLPGFIDMTTIWGMKAPAWELVQKHADIQPNSYYYAFDFDGFWSTCDLSGTSPIPCGIPHIDDMSFTFQIFPIINDDLRVSKRMLKYFVNFAYHGTPNSPDNDDGLLQWPKYDPMTHEFLKIDTVDTIVPNCRDTFIDNSLDIV